MVAYSNHNDPRALCQAILYIVEYYLFIAQVTATIKKNGKSILALTYARMSIYS